MPHPLALAAGCVLDTDAAGVIEAATGAGFDAVGLRVSGPHAVDDPDVVRAAADAAGVTIHDVEVHRIDHTSDPVWLLDVAQALGAVAVLVVSDLDSVVDTEIAIARLAEQCAERDLTLGLEYMAWTIPNGPRAAIEIARRAGCRLVVDVLHHHRIGAGVDDLRAIVEADVLGWLQLCDAPAAAPAHDQLLHEARHARLVPGDGALPLRALLAEIPSNSVVSVEVQSDQMAMTLDPGARARALYTGAARVLSHRV